MTRSQLFGAAVVALGVGALAVAPASNAASNAASKAAASAQMRHVYVVQGVPNASVDVTLDGTSLGNDVATKAIVPVRLAEGDHSVTFKSADFSVTSSFTITSRSTDIVLHWPADSTAKPEVTVFKNDVRAIAVGKGRVTVAHTAVVPPADIRVNGDVLFANVANGQFASVVVPAGTYPVDVVPTGQSGNPLLGPVDLPVAAGSLTRVFAIGAPKNGTDMDAIVQVLPLKTTGSPAPGSVDAGSAGLVAQEPAANRTSDDSRLASAVALGGLVAVCGVLALTRRQRRAQ